jgi:transcriptional regulator with XRE-family HTH domain
MKNPPKKTKLPPLSAAVLHTRESYGDSQPRFAQRVGVAAQTVSRFERGVQVPADYHVLLRLTVAARTQGLTEEASQFEQAAHLAPQRIEQLRDAIGPGAGLWPMPIFSLRQWRLMHIAGIAALYYPETLRATEVAIETAAPEATTLVNEAIQKYGNLPMESGLGFYNQLAQTLIKLAGERDLERLKKQAETKREKAEEGNQ